MSDTDEFLPGDPRSRHGLARIEGSAPGPLVVLVAGMHGNEKRSEEAVESVLAQLAELPIRGTVVGLLGNVAACHDNLRQIHADLNRMWKPSELSRVRGCALEELEHAEERELWSLRKDIDALIAEGMKDPETPTPIFIDVHTASGDSIPFAIAMNTLDHSSLLNGLPVPILAGLAERLDGLMLRHVLREGGRSLAIETGPHDKETGAVELEAVMWMLLIQAGTLEKSQVPREAEHRERLVGLTEKIPPIVEVLYRHHVNDREKFAMRDKDAPEGEEKVKWKSFDRVNARQVVAENHGREVRSHVRGRVIMPLYQPIGEDGFFLGVDRDRPYLFLSELFRKMKLEWTMGLFPSMRRARDHGDAWHLDRSDHPILRELLRFFGYREQTEREDGSVLAIRIRR